MDTNSKKNKKRLNQSCKKICCLFLHMLAAALFCFTILTGFVGREALAATFRFGPVVFSGSYSYLPDFNDYMEDLTSQLLLGYIGADNFSESTLFGYRKNFTRNVFASGTEILYYIEAPDVNPFYNRTLGEDPDTGKLILPPGYRLYCYWDGSIPEVAEAFPYDKLTPQNVILNTDRLNQSRFLLAVRTSSRYHGPIFTNYIAKALGYRDMMIIFTASLVLTFFCAGICHFTRRYSQSARASYGVFARRILLEGKLLLLLVCALAAAGILILLHKMSLYEHCYLLWLCLPAFCPLYLFYVDLRQNKTAFFTHSLVARLIRFCRQHWQNCPWYRKVTLYCAMILTAALVCAFSGVYLLLHPKNVPWQSRFYESRSDLLGIGWLLVFISVCLFAAYLLLRCFVRDVKNLTGRIDELTVTPSPSSLPTLRHSVLKPSMEKLDRLGTDIESAMEQKNRASRLKVELITNVSHDLKTPLTSIINYADLLCEEDLPQPGADYAASLQKKAYRLRDMVQDVFELSKAASGNLHIEKQPLDLAKLIRQTLADMDERISAGTLTFKTVIETEPVMIEADGDKLYRVFQNLFINALQYSLEHSRVHIQLSAKDGCACAKVKNTSREELNFDPDEIVERFVRADNSRTSEGSGLGLSIVQSFTEACGGTFSIELDADMFTACVSFPLTDKEPLSDN